MKAAIVILSDPRSGSDESLGRLFNALAAAFDFKQKGDEVTVLFQGAGTRWAGYLTNASHPAHQLYAAIADKVAGVSCGCSDVFGAHDEAVKNGFNLIKDNAIPGTTGLPSLQALLTGGYHLMFF